MCNQAAPSRPDEPRRRQPPQVDGVGWIVSEVYDEHNATRHLLSAIEESALAQHAEPIKDPEELAEHIWESDEELDAFLRRRSVWF